MNISLFRPNSSTPLKLLKNEDRYSLASLVKLAAVFQRKPCAENRFQSVSHSLEEPRPVFCRSVNIPELAFRYEEKIISFMRYLRSYYFGFGWIVRSLLTVEVEARELRTQKRDHHYGPLSHCCAATWGHQSSVIEPDAPRSEGQNPSQYLK